ncbi:hypothetical protein BU24DRAFT_389955 [Aaosphaeria arxii CBS 175.79]|uniref:Cyclase n=1 Tax=Aaosphaeria arxii CBS 175.79 TaxID=1450172 RepID=A0A6A5XZ78_9PLEO|nr:uncharacterized protein BU24DRAFT_389955 [Aaosphaeria arxii CBS 175.79]KAF2018203.1 hypothetical protein BU24DRAFT_389955 [Aaosphaeria arxii CBS 175.79]
MTEQNVTSLFDTPYDALPDKKRVWQGTPGSREEGLGKLAILTPDVVARAAAEIRTGRRVCLNWELTKLETAGFNRKACEHNIVPLLEGVIYDDTYNFNPQQSSQWDGLRHFSMPNPAEGGKERTERVFYGGTTIAEIMDRSNTRIGIHHWAKEGIAGRGVLIDYAWWAERKGIQYSSFSKHEVKLSEIKEIAKECNIEFRKGDILFVRIGITREWDTKMNEEDKKAYAANPTPEHAGLEVTEDMIRWHWDSGFAAVAGDSIGWEVYPPKDVKLLLHEYLLAGWGMPIGELFDLESLSKVCQELGRWSFFVSSTPFNMPGGVSSASNCMAIF